MDFETFKMLKPHHFKEIIPNINDRIKFETKFEKYFSDTPVEIEFIDTYNGESSGTFDGNVINKYGDEVNFPCRCEQNYTIKTTEVKQNISFILYLKIESLNF